MNTRSGVSGKVVKRPPVAWRTAFATAGAVQMAGASPMPFAPYGPVRVVGLHERDVDLGHFRGGDELVLPERRVHDPSAFDQELLGEGVAEPHDDPALDLPFGAHPVDHAADVVGRRHAQHPDHAGLDVDLHLRDLRGETRRWRRRRPCSPGPA